jgi:ATP-dependent RNA helicase DDX55/SPB4
LLIQYTIQAADVKLAHLVQFLADHKHLKIIVYFATCASTNFFAKIMEAIPSLQATKHFVLHRKVDSTKRQSISLGTSLPASLTCPLSPNSLEIYQEFAESKASLLLCTDIAARGLDIDDIDYVVQFDAPQDPKAFIHRCGRTARAGHEGRALLYLLPNEDAYLDFLKHRKVPIFPYEKGEDEEVNVGTSPLEVKPEAMAGLVKKLNGSDEQMYRKVRALERDPGKRCDWQSYPCFS